MPRVRGPSHLEHESHLQGFSGLVSIFTPPHNIWIRLKPLMPTWHVVCFFLIKAQTRVECIKMQNILLKMTRDKECWLSSVED